MKLLLSTLLPLVSLSASAQSGMTAIIDYIDQPANVECHQSFPRSIPPGTYIVLMYAGKNEADRKAIAVVLPSRLVVLQDMAIAYRYKEGCPLVSAFIGHDGQVLSWK